MSGNLIFDVPQLLFPAIYRPHLIPEASAATFGAAIPADVVPKALAAHLPEPKWVTQLSCDVYRLSGQKPPAVIADRDISTILSCTDAANLPRDMLLTGIPVTLCVALYSMSPRHAPPVNKATIVAIKVTYEDMLRRYDEICAEFFADPSLPYRGVAR